MGRPARLRATHPPGFTRARPAVPRGPRPPQSPGRLGRQGGAGGRAPSGQGREGQRPASRRGRLSKRGHGGPPPTQSTPLPRDHKPILINIFKLERDERHFVLISFYFPKLLFSLEFFSCHDPVQLPPRWDNIMILATGWLSNNSTNSIFHNKTGG